MPESALILVDIQNDFLPGGALAVPDGRSVVPVANRLIPRFELVIATQDWHPANHGSFASQHAGHDIGEVIDFNGLQQVLWPDHCVQTTSGAEFSEELNTAGIHRVFHKGTDTAVDSYSGFFDNGRRNSTGLGDFLRGEGVQRVFVLGLATDYCVKYTALDARDTGLETVLVEDGCRGVELSPGDCERAITELRNAGVSVIPSSDIS